MTEFYDLYDRERVFLGKTHQRGIPVSDGMYHIVVGIWTINTKGQILTTLRDAAKHDCPLMWENTCGCARAGEDSVTAAMRELREETGIAPDASEFRLLSTVTEHHAFIDSYLVVQDIPLDAIVFQTGETCDAKWVFADEMEDMIAEGLYAPPVVRRLAKLKQQLNGELSRYTDRLFRED